MRSANPQIANPYTLKVGAHPGRLFPWQDPAAEQRQVDELVKSSAGLSIELGSGSGGHMLERARQEPSVTWIGFELRFKRAVRTIEKANRLGIPNVYVIRTDGRRLGDFFAPSSAGALYVNFPDPWEKKRVRKHRMLSADVIVEAARVLAPGGLFAVKTDHEEYFKDFLGEIVHSGDFAVEAISNDLHKSEHVSGNVLTEFEKLFLSKAMPIHYLRMRRSGASEEHPSRNPSLHAEDTPHSPR